VNPEDHNERAKGIVDLQCLELPPGEAEAGLRLSRIAGWNQTLEDWSFMLRHGTGVGFRTGAGIWVASMVILPLGPEYGWISMVLTDPDWRRRGLAKRLMAIGMARLNERGLTAALDATPEGEAVYRGIGFTGGPSLARWVVEPSGEPTEFQSASETVIRPMRKEDLERLAAWDLSYSGCDRKEVFKHLLSSHPEFALIEETAGGDIAGYIMSRRGERVTQLGPLVALHTDTAQRLFSAAFKIADGPVYVDAFDNNQLHLGAEAFTSWKLERRFTRMVHGGNPSPGDPDMLFLAAGPELG